MNILSWNCHGIGTPWAFQFLKNLVSQKKPSIIFLCETLCKKDKIERVQKSLGFEGMLAVECEGQGGGLAILWKNKNEVSVASYSINHIDAVVDIQGWSRYRLTGIYGEPNRIRRRSTWELIRNLSRDNNLPWCLIGDMNNVLGQADKRGGRLYPSWLIEGFQEVVDECGLTDLKLQGYPFTWERGRGTEKWVEIRLDRAIVSNAWLNTFQDAKLTNLEVSTSDHCPILLEPKVASAFMRPKKFRFENAWLREPMCKKIVEDVWEQTRLESFRNKIASCSESLMNWGHEITGDFRKRIAHSKKILKATKGRRDAVAVRQFQEESKRLTEVLTQQEVFWKQRSKQLWLKEGDQNSKFFHASAKVRRKANQICELHYEEGNAVGWDTGLEGLMISYFNDLFKSSTTEWDSVVKHMHSPVTEEHNASMLKPVDHQEVKNALFHMHPEKSPGPDGLSPGFYQKYWSTVGGDITRLVQDFFITGGFEEGVTDTNIVLVPKKTSSKLMSDLRPISLCNVVYKVIGLLISETQSAFIPGRLISDNIMIAHEVMHYMKRKITGQKGWMALKLDMSKAYDRVEILTCSAR